MIGRNLNNTTEENRIDDTALRLLIDHGRRQGYLTHDEIIDCIPDAEYDGRILEEVLKAVSAAGIQLTEKDADGGWPQEAFDSGDPTLEETVPIDLGLEGDGLENIEADDALKLYMREATRVPLLTAEEEVELARRIEHCRQAQQELSHGNVSPDRAKELRRIVEEGRMARDRLIRANTRLAISVAKKYTGRGLPFLDLIQEGNIGLMRAIRNFDYHRGYKFSTYATWWIRQAVTRALAEQSRTIRLPVHMSDQVNRMLREQTQLHQKLGRAPTQEEIAEVLDVPVSKVNQMKEIVREPLSLQTPVGEDKDEALGDFIEDAGAPDPEEKTLETLLNEDLKDRLETLPARELQVLQLRYGLTGEEPMTLNEVGQKMGISRERARQLESQALERLRNPEKKRKRREKTG